MQNATSNDISQSKLMSAVKPPDFMPKTISALQALCWCFALLCSLVYFSMGLNSCVSGLFTSLWQAWQTEAEFNWKKAVWWEYEKNGNVGANWHFDLAVDMKRMAICRRRLALPNKWNTQNLKHKAVQISCGVC